LVAAFALLAAMPLAAHAVEDTGMLWLVNYANPISEDYVSSDMRAISGSSQQMRNAAAEAFEKMRDAASTAGIGWLNPLSGYRSYATQSSLYYNRISERQARGMSYAEAVAATAMYTAAPGKSEHQTGLAIDITQVSQSFANTAQGKWLAENSWRFGFILRYTTAKYDYTHIGNEPWHFRYVGAPHAQIAYENNWCWEEYIEQLQAKGSLSMLTDDGMIWEIFWTKDASLIYPYTVERSGDNTGGYIITTYYKADPLHHVYGHWSEPYFKSLFGENDFSFPVSINPDTPVTRAEFAALLSLLPLEERTSEVVYSDVSATAWYYESVMRVTRAGAMQGSDGNFRPQATLNREAAATATGNLIEDKTLAYLTYNDLESISGWAFQSVQKLTAHKIMNGNAQNYFAPKAELTWGESAKLIVSLKAYLDLEAAVPDQAEE
jgi:D-alanyl-D-alanine carboxypeptidase